MGSGRGQKEDGKGHGQTAAMTGFMPRQQQDRGVLDCEASTSQLTMKEKGAIAVKVRGPGKKDHHLHDLSVPKSQRFFVICDCDAHRGPQKSLASSGTRRSNDALRFKGAMESR